MSSFEDGSRIVCPICNESLSENQLEDHFSVSHNIVCSGRECKSLFYFYSRMKEAKISFPVKSFHEFTFEDFLRVLEKADDIFFASDSLDFVRETTEPLMMVIAKKFSKLCIEKLPDIAKEDPQSWRSTLALLTLFQVEGRDVVPVIFELSDFEGFSDFYDEFIDVLKKHKEYIFDCFAEYSSKSDKFRFDLVFEALESIDKGKTAKCFEQFLKKLKVDNPSLVSKLDELLEFFIDTDYYKEEIFHQTIGLVISLINFHDTDHVPSNISEYFSLYELYSELDIFVKARIDLDVDSSSEVLVLASNAQKLGLNMMTKLLDYMNVYPRAKQKMEKVSFEYYEEIISNIKYPLIRHLFYRLFGHWNKLYGNFTVAEYLYDQALKLAEQLYLEEKRDNIYTELLELYVLSGNAQKLEEILRYVEKKKEFEDVGYVIKLVVLGNILLGNSNPALLDLLEKLQEDSFTLILKAYLLDLLGLKETATAIFDEKLKDFHAFSIQELPWIVLAMYRLCNCFYKEAWDLVKSHNKMKAKFLDLVMIKCLTHQTHFIKEIAQQYSEDPILNYYLGVIAVMDHEYEKAFTHLMKAKESKEIHEIPYLILTLLVAFETKREKMIHTLGKKLEKYAQQDHLPIHVALTMYYLWMRDTMRAKYYAKKVKKRNMQLYKKLMKMIKKGRINLEGYMYYIIGRLEKYPERCPAELTYPLYLF